MSKYTLALIIDAYFCCVVYAYSKGIGRDDSGDEIAYQGRDSEEDRRIRALDREHRRIRATGALEPGVQFADTGKPVHG